MNGKVFLDASFWIALRDAREPWHSQARAAVSDLLAQRTVLVFTMLVLAETHAYFSRSPRLRQQILEDSDGNPALVCEPVSPADQVEAVRLLRQHRDKSYSFCDAVSFVVMQRLNLHRVATFDQHFRQFGGLDVID